MMSGTVINRCYTENRNAASGYVPISVIYPPERLPQGSVVLTTKELLARLREKGIKNADIARALGLTPSRVTEMYDGTRALKLDEAVKLAEAFELEPEQAPPVPPLPGPVSQLIVQHIARELGRPLKQDAPQLQELAEDLRAFSVFVTDPTVRESIDLAMTFFQALRLRRLTPEEVS
jgi:transcriptional regulator with XRE-family HTH domain